MRSKEPWDVFYCESLRSTEFKKELKVGVNRGLRRALRRARLVHWHVHLDKTGGTNRRAAKGGMAGGGQHTMDCWAATKKDVVQGKSSANAGRKDAVCRIMHQKENAATRQQGKTRSCCPLHLQKQMRQRKKKKKKAKNAGVEANSKVRKNSSDQARNT